MKRSNRDALTDDEVAFLRSDRAPAAIRHFVARQHEQVGTRTAAYRKVAAAARAEREALMEIAALAVVRRAAGIEDPNVDKVEALEAERNRLGRELETVRERLLQATAMPALAIHSDSTR